MLDGNRSKERRKSSIEVASLSSQHHSASFVHARPFLRLCDFVFTSGMVFLIFFTPLVFGAVHPWAFSLMEVLVFLLVVVWMGKWLFGVGEQEERREGERREGHRLASLFLPLVLFIAFIFFQLIPLPPGLLQFLSPSTYELYTQTFPGWPQQIPYASIASDASGASTESIASIAPDASVASNEEDKSASASEQDTALSAAPAKDARDAPRSTHDALWRPLSLAPALTVTLLLQFLAYVGLFFLVLLYPLEVTNSQHVAGGHQPRPEQRFFRVALYSVLCSGLLIAVLGTVQEFTWNGKFLWFFVPYDWGTSHPEMSIRASGPFISPNHFANYLALIFPLALTGILSGRILAPERRGKALSRGASGAERIFCGFVSFTLTIGILLSLSRGGWIGAVLGVSILLGVFLFSSPEKRPAFLRQPKGVLLKFSLLCCVLLLALALFLVGRAGRRQVDIRFEQTVMNEVSLPDRLARWQDSLSMLRDFPLFGVGLGGWPELHPHYRQPPWTRIFYTEAHNDYLQLLAETGLLGFALLAWFFWQGGRRLYRGLWTASPATFPVLAALMAALGVMAFHEFFDFNLQIPANAFLFTLLFGLALRLAETGVQGPKSKVQSPRSKVQGRFRVPIAVGVGVIALTLCLLALRQGGPPYPYNIKDPDSPVAARELLLAYPAHASAHLDLYLLQDEADPADQLKELEIGLWLDPLNPQTRDLYAAELANQEREEEALQEMTRSVSLAPVLKAHLYLSDLQEEGASSLSEAEAGAVEEGFKQALNSGYAEAADGLGTFYTVMKRFAEAGKVYEEAAAREQSEVQLRYLLMAGLAYAQTEEDNGREKAEALFRQAVQAAPQDPRAYQDLAVQVFAPKGDMTLAKSIIAEGIKNGADTFSLSLSLAEAAQKAGDRKEAKETLQKALALRPSSFEANFRLGLVFLQEKNFDRASLLLRKATNLRPNALAFYQLGVAEEGRYQFFEAQKAYARAVELDPDNLSFRTHYAAFQRKVAEQKSP